ncbi:MAG: efflux RND transporter periplasmic adaptor subunit [Pseudomonadota bacterium]
MNLSKPLLLVFTATLIPFLVLVMILNRAGSQTIDVESPATLKTVAVTPLKKNQSYEKQQLFVGRVEPRLNAALGFELTGLIKQVRVDEGDQVTKGQPLAELDRARLLAQKKEIKARRTQVQADVQLAEKTKRRIRELNQTDVASIQDLDEAEETANNARARLQEIEAQLTRINVDLDKSTLYAPFDGIVSRRFLDPGSVVNAGIQVLTVIQTQSPEARFGVPAESLEQFSIGQTINLHQGDEQVKAEVKRISPIVNPSTRSVDVIINIPEAPHHWREGDLVYWTVTQKVEKEGFWVPQTALADGRTGLWTLNVAVATEGVHTIQQRLVEVIHVEKDWAYVRGALNTQELLVIEGNHRIVPNQQVVVQEINREMPEYVTR